MNHFAETIVVSIGSLALLLPVTVGATSSGTHANYVIGPSSSDVVSTTSTSLKIRKIADDQPSSSKVAVGELSDGRLQVFEITADGRLRSRWKISTDPNSAWTGWVYSTDLPAPFQSIAVGKLPDRRLQLFAVDVNGVSWSKWKVTTDSNSTWTEWRRS